METHRRNSSLKPDYSLPLIVFLGGVAVLSLGTIHRGAPQLGKIGYPNLYVDELIPNWDYYQGAGLNIEGKFECLTQSYCNFVPIPWFSRIAWVDIRALTSIEKRRLELNCHPFCNIRISGDVHLDFIIARGILRIDKNTNAW